MVTLLDIKNTHPNVENFNGIKKMNILTSITNDAMIPIDVNL